MEAELSEMALLMLRIASPRTPAWAMAGDSGILKIHMGLQARVDVTAYLKSTLVAALTDV